MASPTPWRGWPHEPAARRVYFVSSLAVVAVIAALALIGLVRGSGLDDPALWTGLVLVPVLLWLVRRAGLG